jgi:hypothetical protein
MSLSHFVELPDVRERLKPLRPPGRRTFDVPLLASPRTNRYAIVGTAFDYLVRFELQRLAPHAVGDKWVAELALEKMEFKLPSGGTITVEIFDVTDPAHYVPADQVIERGRRIVTEAKAAVATYIANKSPDDDHRRKLAAHAIQLANLDTIARAMRLDPAFDRVTEDDVQDLLAMLKFVPFDKLLHPESMILNPHFNDASLPVGGDADLITGDMLVDFKTTGKAEMDAVHFDRLLGYFMLARKARQSDPRIPIINRLAIYYARRGYLFEFPASVWLERPEFVDVEAWFFQRRNQVPSGSTIDATAACPTSL